MAKFNHEQTNKRVLVSKQHLNICDGWKTLTNKYPSKCAVCNKYIGTGVKILWHVNERLVMHKSDCLTNQII